MTLSLSDVLTEPSASPPTVLLYGVNGIGKSTFIAEAPKPILFDFEGGASALGCTRTPRITSYENLLTLILELATSKHSYSTLGLDTADWLEKLIFAKVVADNGKTGSIENVPYGRGYAFAQHLWLELIAALEALRKVRPMAIIFTAHARVKSHSAPGLDAFDRYQPDLNPKSSMPLIDWCDYTLFGNYRVFTETKGEGFKEKTHGAGDGERVIYTQERPAHVAKSRWSIPYELPFRWADFAKAHKVAVSANKRSRAEDSSAGPGPVDSPQSAA